MFLRFLGELKHTSQWLPLGLLSRRPNKQTGQEHYVTSTRIPSMKSVHFRANISFDGGQGSILPQLKFLFFLSFGCLDCFLDLVSSELEYVGTVFEAWNVKNSEDHAFEKIHHGAMTSFLQSPLTSAAWSLSRPPTTLLYLSAHGSGLCVTVFHPMC